MADGELDVGLNVDLGGASPQVQKFSKQVNEAIADLRQLSKATEEHITRLTDKLNKAFSKAAPGSDERMRVGNRIERLRSQAYGSIGSGNSTGANIGLDPSYSRNDALVRRTIFQMNNEYEQAENRIRQARLTALKRGLHSSDPYLTASASKAERSAADFVRRESNSALQAAQTARSRRNENDLIRENQVGRGQAGMERTMERLNSNGGANLAAIQTKVLIGYQAIAASFNALKGASSFVVGLDKEFRQFQAITATTNTEMQGLEKRLISVSETTKFTALEVASAATTMGQAGLSAVEVADSIEAVTLLATAAGTELAPAVDLVTSTLSIFNLQTSQTADIANTMTAAINGSKLTIDKLTLGFQYAGNIAAQLGITYTELTATLGALANSGIKSGSTLGTGLRQLLVDLETPTEKFSARLRSLGLVQADVDVKSRGLVSVLKTLKDAGFGGAEAFESFEVRAAAAFVALANNLDVQSRLQKQFVLSNASVEANAVQMESLANTYAKLQSVLGTIVYKGFRPFMDVLQTMANTTANVLSYLNKVPFALEAVSVALVGVGVGVTASAFSAMFRALGAGLPLFASYTAATAALATSQAAATATASRLTVVTHGLNAAIRANPFVIAIAAVAAAATAYKSLTKETVDLLDKQKAMISTLEGQAQTAQGEIEAVEQTVANLIQRKDELDRDPILREAKILEVIQQFKQLGSEISTTTSTVQDLIDALGNIKKVDFGDQVKILSEQVEAIAENIAILKAQDQKNAKGDKSSLGRAGIDMLTTEQKKSIEKFMVRGGQATFISEAFKTKFAGNDDVANSVDLATGRKNDTASNIAGYQAGLKTMLRKAQNQFSLLEIDDDPATRKARNDLEDEINGLTALIDAVQDRLKYAIDVEKNETDLEIADISLKRSNARANLAGQGLEKVAVSSTTKFTGLVEEAERKLQDPTTSVAEAAEIATNLKEAFDKEDARLEERLKVWRKTYLAMNPDTSEATVDTAIAQMLTTERAQLENRIGELAVGAMKNAAELNEAAQQAYSKTLDKTISTRMKLTSSSNNREDVEATQAWIKVQMAGKREIINKLYDGKSAQESTTLGKEKLEYERQAMLDQIDEEQTGLINTLSQQVLGIIEDMYQEGIKRADRDIDVLNSNLKDLEGDIKKAKPGEMMDKLIRQYNDLVGALSTALETKETLELGVGAYTGVSSSRGDVLDRIIQIESNGNPLARAKTSSAGGLAQFTEGTWREVMNKHFPQMVASMTDKQLLGMRFDGKMARRGLEKFTGDNQAYLEQRGLKATDGATYLAHFLGKGGAAKVLGANPNTPISQVVGANQIAANPGVFKNMTTASDLVGWAEKKMGGIAKTNTAAVTKETQDALTEAVYVGTTKAVKAEVAANVKANRAQIAGRTAASSASGDPSTIADNMNAIDVMFDKIVAERVREFEQVNMKALAAGDEETKAQLEDLKDQLNSERSTKLSSLVDDYQKAAEDVVSKPLEEARAKLAAAQDPNNKGKFSIPQINKLQNDVDFLEREQAANAASVAEQKLVLIRGELAEATKRSGANSEEALTWLQREAQANRELSDALAAVGIQKAAQEQAPMNSQGAFAGAVTSWQLNSGFMKMQDGIPTMLSQAEQMESVWGNVLNTMSSGFSQFFKDLASGTMSAGEAFRGFALTVIQSFMDMIAQALAFQMVQSMIKGVGGSAGGGFLGTLAEGIFSVPKAANGEMVSGGVPNRDSVLRQVMPGEMILRKSAVDSIGSDALVNLNNMGNRRISTTAPEAMAGQGGGGMVNVYVVSPDNVPSMGPNDIIATIADDVSRKGTIRQLIKSVQMGAA